jgi:hypothetical protein
VSEAGADDEAAVVTLLVPPEDTQITPVHPGTQQHQEEQEGLPLSASVAEEKRRMSSSHRVILPSLAADVKEEESCGKGLGGAGENAVMSLLESDDEVVAISGTSFGGSVEFACRTTSPRASCNIKVMLSKAICGPCADLHTHIEHV